MTIRDVGFEERVLHAKLVVREILERHDTIVVAFSGGKDSTLLLHMVVDQLLGNKTRFKPQHRLFILFNDTLAEIPFIHSWAVKLGQHYERLLNREGFEAHFVIVKPRLQDSFYWRVVIDGYPAPTFKFRWCTTLLKIEPFREALYKLSKLVGKAALLTGSRDSESRARARSLASKTLGCNGEAGTCLSEYMLRHDFGPMYTRYAPIRRLKDDDVWSLLLSYVAPPGGGPRYEMLHRLYEAGKSPACKKVRFGCWFCTVTARHCGLRAAIEAAGDSTLRINGVTRDAMNALWLLRLLYRRISDKKTLREQKSKGYSRLGPLKPVARAALLQALRGVYRAYGAALLYGLEEEITRGVTLAKLFFDLEPYYARTIVERLDRTPRAVTDFELLRDEDYTRRNLEKHGGSDVVSLYEKLIALPRSRIRDNELQS